MARITRIVVAEIRLIREIRVQQKPLTLCFFFGTRMARITRIVVAEIRLIREITSLWSVGLTTNLVFGKNHLLYVSSLEHEWHELHE